MTRYIIRRVLILLPVWLAAYTLTFTLYHLTPGGPWDREKPLPPQGQWGSPLPSEKPITESPAAPASPVRPGAPLQA